jgi:hypothetical protein
MKTRIVSTLLDVSTGLIALTVFLVIDGFFHVAADLRTSVISVAALYLCAGVIRGRSGSVWLRGLLVGGSGALVLVILLWAQIHHAALAILVSTVVLFGLCGVRARHYWTARSAIGVASMVLVPLAALTIVALTTFPTLAARFATRTTIAPSPTFEVSRVDGSLIRCTDWRTCRRS